MSDLDSTLTPTIFVGDDSAYMTICQKRRDPTKIIRMSMKAVLSEKVPSLSIPYRQCWWLPNGHLQTAYCVAGNFESVDFMEYRRYVHP